MQELRNDTVLLKQRLTNSLTLQRNLEGELAELTKEKKLLEAENKNLAIKIVPLLTDSLTNRVNHESMGTSSRQTRSRAFSSKYSMNTDNLNMNQRSYTIKNSQESNKPTYLRCSRSASIGDISQAYNDDEDEDEKETLVVLSSVSESHLPSDSESDEVLLQSRRRPAKSRERDDLDSITSYVRWKNLDFNRLHGKLHKSIRTSLTST